jgi:molybdopterin adenylyltransferase
MNKTKIKIGFITISDRAARGEYKDIGGPAMQTWIQQAVLSPYKVESIMIEDEQALIEQTMVDFADLRILALQNPSQFEY